MNENDYLQYIMGLGREGLRALSVDGALKGVFSGGWVGGGGWFNIPRFLSKTLECLVPEL